MQFTLCSAPRGATCLRTVIASTALLGSLSAASVYAESGGMESSSTSPSNAASRDAARSPDQRPEIRPLAEIGGVLTPRGRLVVENSLQYGNSQLNRFTFRGVEILDALLVGAVEAEDSDQDVYSVALSTRYGLSNRLEYEIVVPYVRREQRLATTIPQANTNVMLVKQIDGEGLGDIEQALHYQINGGRDGAPFFIANLRYKATTGLSPFDVDRDGDGIETELATGSGFHAVEPSVTVLYRSDPAVFFSNLGYLYNFSKDIDKTFGDQTIGRVDPGGAVRLSFGMGYSINERASMTLGYKQDFIQKTTTEINDTEFESSRLRLGTLLVGFSLGISDRTALSVSLQFGVTDDAPDLLLDFRVPMAFQLFD